MDHLARRRSPDESGMDKKSLNERDICTKFITPAMRGAAKIDCNREAATGPQRGLLLGVCARGDGLSFPLAYVQAHGLAADWPAFLDDFQLHWPTDEDI
jgi:hypothetical protein